jgi:glucan phosphoethanolaminetransferase (alkaline phosphatase superfamily)
MEKLNKKLSVYFWTMVSCALLVVLSFIGFGRSELASMINQIFAWGIILGSMCVIVFFILSCGVQSKITELKNQESLQNLYDRVKHYKELYSKSLSNGDKIKSIEYGRIYYGLLGYNDEQRLTNDLLCYLNK